MWLDDNFWMQEESMQTIISFLEKLASFKVDSQNR